MKEDELLDLLRDCHDVFDSLLAKVISLDPGFMPSKTWYWKTMVKLANVLRATGRLT
jgi:hypothetical protein